MIILRAGMSGLLAACQWDGPIYDDSEGPHVDHRALLRFKTKRVQELTNIECKEVTVSKSIHYGEEFDNRMQANMAYSKKVTGKYYHRSIMDTKTETRYIPPHNFHHQLLDQFEDRIMWKIPYEELFHNLNKYTPLVSTLDFSHIRELLGLESIKTEVLTDEINICHATIPDCDIYATLYFPGQDTPVYRASFSGDSLIIEGIDLIANDDVRYVLHKFGIKAEPHHVNHYTQKKGKIKYLDDSVRKKALREVSRQFNIWSLGRYACWRNILLDDVVKDIYAIDFMIKEEEYDLIKRGSNG